MKKLTFVRKMASRYSISDKEILKTTLLYSDGKTQVPKKVVELLSLEAGSSTIVWIRERGRVFIESAKQIT